MDGEYTPLSDGAPARHLRAVPTPYSGYAFRSRTEARWAVSFEALSLEYRYEEERYFVMQPLGETYLPDFYLPELRSWIEIKGQYPTQQELRKVYLFNQCLASKAASGEMPERAYILYGGIPWPFPKEGNLIGFGGEETGENEWGTIEGLCLQACPVCQEILIGKIDTMSCEDCVTELSRLLDDALEVVDSIPDFDRFVDVVPAMVSGALSTGFFRSGHKAPALRAAYGAGRAARFEGGHKRLSA